MRPGQLPLDLSPETPRQARAGALRSFYAAGQPIPVPEALAGEAAAQEQDAQVLAVFLRAPGAHLTPTEVLEALQRAHGQAAPLLTSVRRSMSTMTERRLLVHYSRERRPSPRGGTESAWGLA